MLRACACACRLPARGLAVVEAATFRKLPAFQPRELGALLWGLCAMGHTPSGDWLEDYAGQVLVKASHFASQVGTAPHCTAPHHTRVGGLPA